MIVASDSSSGSSMSSMSSMSSSTSSSTIASESTRNMIIIIGFKLLAGNKGGWFMLIMKKTAPTQPKSKIQPTVELLQFNVHIV